MYTLDTISVTRNMNAMPLNVSHERLNQCNDL